MWHQLDLLSPDECFGSVGGMCRSIVHMQKDPSPDFAPGTASSEGMDKSGQDLDEKVSSHCAPGILIIHHARTVKE